MLNRREINATVSSCDNCPYAHRVGTFSGTYECLVGLGSHKSRICYTTPVDVTENVKNSTFNKKCRLKEVGDK